MTVVYPKIRKTQRVASRPWFPDLPKIAGEVGYYEACEQKNNERETLHKEKKQEGRSLFIIYNKFPTQDFSFLSELKQNVSEDERGYETEENVKHVGKASERDTRGP